MDIHIYIYSYKYGLVWVVGFRGLGKNYLYYFGGFRRLELQHDIPQNPVLVVGFMGLGVLGLGFMGGFRV